MLGSQYGKITLTFPFATKVFLLVKVNLNEVPVVAPMRSLVAAMAAAVIVSGVKPSIDMS